MPTERLSVFPAFHKVSGRTVLVVGSGAEAAAKARLLGETDARVRLVAPTPTAELSALAAEHNLDLQVRPFEEAHLDGAVLVFAASGNADEDAAVVAAARARNIPANAVDNPDLCDFYTPAIVNRAPVAVAITSTGAGPVLAQKLRARIEAMLPPGLGALASLGQSFRAAADRVLPKGQPRRRFWSAFFDGRIAEAALAGKIGEARRLASRLLTEAEQKSEGLVSLVGAGPGAADLLTLRAQRLLQEADVVVYEHDVPEALVAMGRRDAVRIAAGRRDDVAALLVREASAGRRVVHLALGDADANATTMLKAAGIPFDIVPGVAALVEDARVMAA